MVSVYIDCLCSYFTSKALSSYLTSKTMFTPHPVCTFGILGYFLQWHWLHSPGIHTMWTKAKGAHTYKSKVSNLPTVFCVYVMPTLPWQMMLGGKKYEASWNSTPDPLVFKGDTPLLEVVSPLWEHMHVQPNRAYMCAGRTVDMAVSFGQELLKLYGHPQSL